MTYGDGIFAGYYNAQRTAKAYVQDGLIAMWDGIENAGWGVHDGNATSWMDIVNNRAATRYDDTKQPVWGADHWESTASDEGQAFDATLPSEILGEENLTFETVTERFGGDSGRGIICGQYGISGPGGFNLEKYGNATYRAYWNGAPDMSSPHNTYPKNIIKYFAVTRTSPSTCRILNETGGVLTQSTGNWVFTGTVWRIGCDSRITNMCFYGNIYCIRLYNRALTAAEIAHNYAIDKVRFNIQ